MTMSPAKMAELIEILFGVDLYKFLLQES